jgi:hypothetical protein
MRYSRLHFQAEPFELLRHQLGRPRLAVGKLRVLMDVAAPRNDLRLDARTQLIYPGAVDSRAGRQDTTRQHNDGSRNNQWSHP